MKKRIKSHDLSLPAWGPYTKKYSGISHIPAANDGTRFDLSVFPGLYRRPAAVPNVRFESGFHVFGAAADLSCYTLRHEIEWKDRVYADISFAALSEHARLIRAECRNETDIPQNLVLHYMASAYDPCAGYSGFPITGADLSLPENAVLVYANEYDDLRFARPRPTDSLVWDGARRAEEAVCGFTRGYGVGCGFGGGQNGAGDTVCYTFRVKAALRQPVLGVRYCNHSSEDALFTLSTRQELLLPPCEEPQLLFFPLPPVPEGGLRLTLTSCGRGAAKFDCFTLCEEAQCGEIDIRIRTSGFVPELRCHEDEGFLTLRYPHIRTCYGIAWDYPDAQIREIENDELDIFLRETVHDHVSRVLKGNANGHFTNVFLRPIPLAPHESRTILGIVCCADTHEQAAECCRSLMHRRGALDGAWQAACAKMQPPPMLAPGKAYFFGQQLLRAVLCTNVVYPVYVQGQYIRHNTPGRWWDSLYTWDSGFIGIGLAPISLRRAFDCLNAYLTYPDNDEAAFIHHGSLVPVQFYLFAELLNRTGSRALVQYCLPQLLHYYRFFTGQSGSSTLADLKSGLLRPWDYFYNSGGWDDYPAQLAVHKQKLEHACTPVCTTAQAVRCARILAYAARLLGSEGLARQLDDDAERFTRALQQHAWNEAAGCFSYVLHDEEGRPAGPLLDETGVDANLGLDGLSPLYAGACTQAQADILWDKLASCEHFCTECGLSTVDRAAPYYRHDGYWNGAVWMPHQWFFFKAALDAGRGDDAFFIADTALSLWQRECRASYHCFEHFMIESGRGAGWHQFGGLCGPIVSWFADYYIPGTFTTGFDTFLRASCLSDDQRRAQLTLDCTRGGRCTILAVLAPGRCRITADAPISGIQSRMDGQWEITLEPESARTVHLAFEPECECDAE